MDDWLTIMEMAQQANLSETTARCYASRFAPFVPHRTVGRITKYAPDTVGILMQVARLYQEGRSTPEVLAWLQREVPQTVEVEAESADPPTPPLSPSLMLTLLAAQNTTLTRIAETLDKPGGSQ
jgi:hypothetical protein